MHTTVSKFPVPTQHFYCLLAEDGDLYTFGETEDGKLGQGAEPADNTVPTKVDGIEGKVVQVSCGSKHTAVVTGIK